MNKNKAISSGIKSLGIENSGNRRDRSSESFIGLNDLKKPNLRFLDKLDKPIGKSQTLQVLKIAFQVGRVVVTT